MPLNTAYIHCTGYSPYANQALEKYLVETVAPDTVILYLWQNQRTVVIGKNQNAWQECKVAEISADGGYVARRISGGGAVYHDLGNLNFTFVLAKAHYDIPRQQQVICRALRKLGIAAEVTGRNDIVVDGKKISGNAFYEGKNCFHHGTLLISVDTAEMGRYLNPSAAKLQAKGVSSVKARVANLNTFLPGLTPESLGEALIQALGEEYGSVPQEMFPAQLDQARLAELTQEFADEGWRLGRPIPCDLTLSQRFDWGEVELRLQENRGKVQQVQVFTDSLAPELSKEIETALMGVAFSSQALAKKAKEAGLPTEIALLLEKESF